MSDTVEIRYRVCVHRKSLRLDEKDRTDFDRLEPPVRNEIIAKAIRLPWIGVHQLRVLGHPSPVRVKFERQPASSLCILLDFKDLSESSKELARDLLCECPESNSHSAETDMAKHVKNVLDLGTILREEKYVLCNFPRRKKVPTPEELASESCLRELSQIAARIIHVLSGANGADTNVDVAAQLREAAESVDRHVADLRANVGIVWV